VTGCASSHGGFHHCALLYRTEDQYLRGVVGFIEQGLRAREPVVVAVPAEKLELVRDSLEGRHRAVQLVDMSTLGRNPARLIPSYTQLLKGFAGRHVWFVGEPVWPGRTQAEIEEAILHEALSNRAFRGQALSGLCPYDTERLHPAVIAGVRATHPFLADGTSNTPNHRYAAARTWQEFLTPLDPPPTGAASLAFAAGELPRVRALVDRHACDVGLDPDRRSDLVLAVNEVATNSIVHGGGKGKLFAWHANGRVVFEIHDAGEMRDPLLGRLLPEPGQAGGRGLWLTNQLCELVQLRTGDNGTNVRLQMTLDPTPA
jgi:anti-sigma regulatory factor (Ser/Thr protein kinase)